VGKDNKENMIGEKRTPVKPSRSYTPGHVPLPSDLEIGEFFYNVSDLKMYTKNIEEQIVLFTLPVAVGGVAPLADVSKLADIPKVQGKTVHVRGRRGGIFKYDSSKKDINDNGVNFNGWIRQLPESKTIHVKWFSDIRAGIRAEVNPNGTAAEQELDLDHTHALKRVEAFIKSQTGADENKTGWTIVTDGVYYSTETISFGGIFYTNFKGTGHPHRQDGRGMFAKWQYRGTEKGSDNKVFVDCGANCSFKNMTFWGNGCTPEVAHGSNFISNPDGIKLLKIERSWNGRNLALKYGSVGIQSKDSWYTRSINTEMKQIDTLFEFRASNDGYNAQHFGFIAQEMGKFWNFSPRQITFTGGSFEHYKGAENRLRAETSVTFSAGCYFESIRTGGGTLFKLENRAMLNIKNSMLYLKNLDCFVDAEDAYHANFVSEDNFIEMVDTGRIGSFYKLPGDNRSSSYKLSDSYISSANPKKQVYINRVPDSENTAFVKIPTGYDQYTVGTENAGVLTEGKLLTENAIVMDTGRVNMETTSYYRCRNAIGTLVSNKDFSSGWKTYGNVTTIERVISHSVKWEDRSDDDKDFLSNMGFNALDNKDGIDTDYTINKIISEIAYIFEIDNQIRGQKGEKITFQFMYKILPASTATPYRTINDNKWHLTNRNQTIGEDGRGRVLAAKPSGKVEMLVALPSAVRGHTDVIRDWLSE